MAYPKTTKLDNTSGDYGTAAATAPVAASVQPLPSTNINGGAPRLQRKSLSSNWAGAAASRSSGYSLPTPSPVPLRDMQTSLSGLQKQVKTAFDERIKQLGEQEVAGSRFWRMYKDMPDAAAALVARRIWTNQMVASGNVADWMKWVEGK